MCICNLAQTSMFRWVNHRANLSVLALFILVGFLLVLSGWQGQKQSDQELASRLKTFKIDANHQSSIRESFDGAIENQYETKGMISESLIVNITPIPSFTWVPVDAGERNEYTGKLTCFGPLKHCCIGQCRQPSYALPSTDDRLFRKPSIRLNNLTDLLWLLETKVKKPPEQACRLVILGDSLAGDHIGAAICQLYRLGYKTMKCINKEMFGTDRRYGEKQFCPGPDRQKDAGPFTLHLERTDHDICPNVILQTANPHKYNHSSSLELDSNGIFVWSWGVHAIRQGELREYMLENLVDMARSMKTDYPNWHLLFLESEPQHFKTADGNWKDKVLKCRKLTVTNTSKWRNREAAKTIAEQNLQVPIVPIYDHLLPLWDLHYGKGDCTHYCYTPWRFDVTWHGIIQAVEANLVPR